VSEPAPPYKVVYIIRPLAMRYGLYESRRLVMVTAPPVLLPKSET
jgi:hypothetical protein